ncbi:MAG TPA: 2-C-methyl-D-erythritol 4-phosphate cytidylyltransferase, partial [Fimbriimonas sp.]|nr:2-C-methyl-D-erythritol 4-phosphate cytidylyltransferase [Fimbriimonas sp.]
MKLVAVLLAAGSGQRFGGDKLAEVVGGKPVWQHSFETLLNHPLVNGIVVVTSPTNYTTIREQVGERAEVILGGDTRTASTIAGMWKAAQVGATHIAFH